MSILAQRIVASGIAKHPRESCAHAFCCFECAIPFLVYEFGSIIPGPHVGIAAAIRPGLMRMAGQEETLADLEAGVVRGETLTDSIQRKVTKVQR